MNKKTSKALLAKIMDDGNLEPSSSQSIHGSNAPISQVYVKLLDPHKQIQTLDEDTVYGPIDIKVASRVKHQLDRRGDVILEIVEIKSQDDFIAKAEEIESIYIDGRGRLHDE